MIIIIIAIAIVIVIMIIIVIATIMILRRPFEAENQLALVLRRNDKI